MRLRRGKSNVDSFHVLLDGGDIEIEMKDLISEEPMGRLWLFEEAVLDYLHSMNMMRLGVCEDYTSVGTNAFCT